MFNYVDKNSEIKKESNNYDYEIKISLYIEIKDIEEGEDNLISELNNEYYKENIFIEKFLAFFSWFNF